MNFDQSGALYLIVTHNQVALYDLQMLLLTTGLVGDKENLWAINLAGDSRDLARLVDGLRRVHRIFAAPAVKNSILGLFPSTFDDHVREMMVPSLATWLKTGVVALAIDASPLTRRLAERFALSPGVNIDALVADDEALEAWVRDKVCGGWHATGTCKMGAGGDPLAVLDGQCRVRGVEGLRVVDASVMPTSVSANTNITTIMIAEKIAAEMLGQ